MHMHKNQIKRKILNYANMQKCTERALHCSYAALSQFFFFCYFTLRAAHNNKYGQIVDTLGKIKNTWQISGQTINGNY